MPVKIRGWEPITFGSGEHVMLFLTIIIKIEKILGVF